MDWEYIQNDGWGRISLARLPCVGGVTGSFFGTAPAYVGDDRVRKGMSSPCGLRPHVALQIQLVVIIMRCKGVQKKELLFTVSASDCEWQFCRGSGAGGQNRNKRDTAVVCIHRESGAIGKSCEERSQLQNRRTAFGRMAKTEKFRIWNRCKANEQIVGRENIMAKIDKELDDPKITVVEFFTP